MTTRSHRLIVLGCMLSWFLLGLHAPILHAFTGHGQVPRPSVLAAVLVIAAGAIVGLLVLLRAPRGDRV